MLQKLNEREKPGKGRATLRPRPARFALLDEGTHPLAAIFGGEQSIECLLFLFQAGFGYVGLMSVWEGAREWWARFGFQTARSEANLDA